jgi:hypothetical protein
MKMGDTGQEHPSKSSGKQPIPGRGGTESGTPDDRAGVVDAERRPVTVSGQCSLPDFAAALAMIATLPLSDAEKAEAVRRLLAASSAHQ